jgi:hypothetical protein
MMLRKKGLAADPPPQRPPSIRVAARQAARKTGDKPSGGNGCGWKSAYGEGELDGAETSAPCGKDFDPLARDRAFGKGGIGSRMFQTHACIGQS